MGRALVVAAVVVSLVAGCTDGGSDQATTTTAIEATIAEPATVVRASSPVWPECLNPVLCRDDAVRHLVLEHVLPRLMEVDAGGVYRPSPVLAGDPVVEQTPAGTVQIGFEIAAEAVWQDGRPITSTDVVGTWHALLSTPGADLTGYERILTIDDADPDVAVVTLTGPYADWPELFGGRTGWLLQADALVAGTDLTGRFADALPFGAGPYVLTAFDANRLVLAANEAYWAEDRMPALDQVEIERQRSGLSQLDLVVGPAPADADDGWTTRSRPLDRVVGLFFDHRSPALADSAVRSAMDAVIDRRDLVEAAESSGATASDLVTCAGWLPGEPGCDQSDLVEIDPDPAEAARLLDEAGWLLDEVGRRVRDGVVLAVPVTYDPFLPGADEVAEAVAGALSTVAIGAEVAPMSDGEWWSSERGASSGVGVFAVRLGTTERLAALYACAERPNPMAWCDETAADLAGRVLANELGTGAAAVVAGQLGDLVAAQRVWLPLHQFGVEVSASAEVGWPEVVPTGSGPLGHLWAFTFAGG